MATPALLVSSGVFGSYLMFYTAYSKTTKTLEPSSLTDVVLFKKGVDHTLVQLNKVAALTGLTQLGLSFIPEFLEATNTNQQELLTITTYMLLTHTTYSTYRYYASAKMPRISTYPRMFSEAFSAASSAIEKLMSKRKFAVLCGSACFSLTYLLCLDDHTYVHSQTKVAVDSMQEHAAEMSGLLALGLLHFYFIEVDVKGNLPVRPYGYLAFLAPAVALASATRYILS